MPGPFPGRVVEVRHPAAVSAAHEINDRAVTAMMDRGMCELTGADRRPAAWRSLFEPSDVVGIKVNPVGRKGNAPAGTPSLESISSSPCCARSCATSRHIGVPPRNIIVFERYAEEFRDAGYERDWAIAHGRRSLVRLGHAYDDTPARHRRPGPAARTAIRTSSATIPTCLSPWASAQPAHRRATIAASARTCRSSSSRMVNKIITIPCLKDHRSAGVTLALKNMSHGMNNNVARSHIPAVYRLDGSPRAARTSATRSSRRRSPRSRCGEKATLHIMDGLIGVYEGGPGPWNRPWAPGGAIALLRHRPGGDGPRRLGHHRRQAGAGGLAAGGATWVELATNSGRAPSPRLIHGRYGRPADRRFAAWPSTAQSRRPQLRDSTAASPSTSCSPASSAWASSTARNRSPGRCQSHSGGPSRTHSLRPLTSSHYPARRQLRVRLGRMLLRASRF